MNKIKTYDLCTSSVRKFLNLNNNLAELKFIRNVNVFGNDHQYVNINFNGESDKQYLVEIKEGNNIYKFKTSKNNFYDFGAFIPGKTYWAKVKQGTKIVYNNSFKIKNSPVRYLNVEHIDNVRDLGGWKTIDGKSVKYGYIIRGSKLSDNKNEFRTTNNSLRVLKDYLNIKTEIDLRIKNVDDDKQIRSPIKNAIYYKITLSGYNSIFPYREKPLINADYDSRTPLAMRKLFNLFKDENNYPIYLHCIGGADRAGTLSFLILGLLGVPVHNLIKEYELTSFLSYAERYRGEIVNNKVVMDNLIQKFDIGENYVSGFGYFVSEFSKYFGIKNQPFSKAVENYLVNFCKINKKTVNQVKNILLSN